MKNNTEISSIVDFSGFFDKRLHARANTIRYQLIPVVDRYEMRVRHPVGGHWKSTAKAMDLPNASGLT